MSDGAFMVAMTHRKYTWWQAAEILAIVKRHRKTYREQIVKVKSPKARRHVTLCCSFHIKAELIRRGLDSPRMH